MIDWTKPIRFKNGERALLIETHPEGCPNFPDKTRIVERLDQDTSTLGGAMSSLWWFKEDGKSTWPEEYGYDLENIEGGLSDEA